MHMYASSSAHGKGKDFWESILCVPGIKLRSDGLEVSPCISWAVLQACSLWVLTAENFSVVGMSYNALLCFQNSCTTCGAIVTVPHEYFYVCISIDRVSVVASVVQGEVYFSRMVVHVVWAIQRPVTGLIEPRVWEQFGKHSKTMYLKNLY